MQSKSFFTDRAVFYASSKIYDQAPKGKEGWDFSLKEVYFIGVMDFTFDATPEKKYIHHVRLSEEEDNHAFYDKLGYIFIELPKFDLAEKEIKTSLEQWLYALRNMNKFDKIPVILHNEIFRKLFEISEVANLKKEEYMVYEKSVLDKWTEYSVLKTAEEKGLEKGIEKGIEKKNFEVVQNLLSTNRFTIAEIANFAGVTESFVKKLQSKVEKKSNH